MRDWKKEKGKRKATGCRLQAAGSPGNARSVPPVACRLQPVALFFFLFPFSFCLLPAFADIAEVVPADSLLYIEVAKPADLWAALQKTELRQAVKSSLVTEFILNFTASTADLFSRSLVNRPLSEAAERYGFSLAVAFAPVQPGGAPAYAVILEATQNAAELRELLLKNAGNTLTARFPDVRVTRERIAGSGVQSFAFSPKHVWCLAVCRERVIFGGRTAVTWMLKAARASTRFAPAGGASLASRPAFRAIRADAIGLSRKTHPAGPGVFGYAEISEAAGLGSIIYARGTQIAGALDVDGALIRDVTLLRGPLSIPQLGKPGPCSISAAFPPGPYIIHQVSFASDADVLQFMPVAALPDLQADDDSIRGVFSGIGFVAESPQANGPVIAAEIADASRLGAFMERLGLLKNGDGWASPLMAAELNGRYVYLGAAADVDGVIRRLRAPNAAKLDDRQNLIAKLLPKTGHGYSLMTSDFLKSIPWAVEFEFIKPAAAGLPPACAHALKTDDGLVITSISPCGYAIWLVSANVACARNGEPPFQR